MEGKKKKRYNFEKWYYEENNTQVKIPETIYIRWIMMKIKHKNGFDITGTYLIYGIHYYAHWFESINL